MVVGKRRFLLKREKASVICEFDLGQMRDYIAILSGRANTVRFADKLRQRLGDATEQWLPEFLRSYHDARD
jgi:type IV secretion system protein VirB4